MATPLKYEKFPEQSNFFRLLTWLGTSGWPWSHCRWVAPETWVYCLTFPGAFWEKLLLPGHTEQGSSKHSPGVQQPEIHICLPKLNTKFVVLVQSRIVTLVEYSTTYCQAWPRNVQPPEKRKFEATFNITYNFGLPQTISVCTSVPLDFVDNLVIFLAGLIIMDREQTL